MPLLALELLEGQFQMEICAKSTSCREWKPKEAWNFEDLKYSSMIYWFIDLFKFWQLYSSTLRLKQFLCNLIRNSFFGAVHQSYSAWEVGKSHPHRCRRLRCHLTHSFCAVGGRGNGGNHRNHTVVTLLSGLLTALFFSYANSDSDFSNLMSHFICDLLSHKVN